MNALSVNTSGYQSPHLPAAISSQGSLAEINVAGIHERLKYRFDTMRSIRALHTITHEHKSAIRFFSAQGSAISSIISSVSSTIFNDPETAIKVLDAECWANLMADAVLTDAMSSKQKAEWDKLISDRNVPEFTEDHVFATVQNFINSQGMYFASRVDQVFHGLSPDHVTNSPSAFGKRLIIKKVLSDPLTVSSDKSRLVDDLRVVMAIVLGRAPVKTSRAMSYDIINNLRRNNTFGEWVTLDGGALRVKLFKVGTLHAELHPDAIYKLNDVLSMLYPHAIPECFRRAPKKASVDFPQPISNTLPIEVLADLNELKRINVRCDIDLRREYEGYEIIYSFARVDLRNEAETESVLYALGGQKINITCWTFDYDITEHVIPTLLRTGVMPNKQSFQYYPSKGDVGAMAANTLRSHIDDTCTILEPSIGQAHLADHFGDTARFVGVELSPVNLAVTKTKGYKCELGDFLSWANTCDRLFSAILMNPPFKDRQALAHTIRAAQLLDKDGVLVAIVPAGAQSEAISETISNNFKGYRISKTDTQHNAFDDASVSVDIITIARDY